MPCYARIDAGLSAGDTLVFEVSNNFIVDYYDGTKSIVVSNTNDLGGRNLYWGQSLPAIGAIVLVLALLIAVSVLVPLTARPGGPRPYSICQFSLSFFFRQSVSSSVSNQSLAFNVSFFAVGGTAVVA